MTGENPAEKLRSFLEGWEAAELCLAETLSWLPDDQVVYVIRERQRRLGIEDRVASFETMDG